MSTLRKGYLEDHIRESMYGCGVRSSHPGPLKKVYYRVSNNVTYIEDNPQKLEIIFAELLWILSFCRKNIVGNY